MAMDEEDTEQLKALIEIHGFIKTVKDKGIEHPVLDALDRIARRREARRAVERPPERKLVARFRRPVDA